ncbi:MAG: hypothetical protein HY059_06120 [Proteobacteria bacterium]|nr:hypothetical protein [Pseudomonadota bacterium]
MTRHWNFITATAVLLLAAPLVAQSATPAAASNAVQDAMVSKSAIELPEATNAPAAPSAAADRAPVAGPTQASATVGVRAAAAPLALPKPSSNGNSPAMMIVGGAALIVGAVVGGQAGTIVMIAGGIIGLVGLWNYLQ